MTPQLGGRGISLPGPAPPVDLSRYVLVSGFSSAARTDAVMAPIKAATKAVAGCEDPRFHWIDDTSGVADCKSAEGVTALLEAAAAAAAAAASGGTSEPATRVVDPTRPSLEDFELARMTQALLEGAGEPKEAGEEGEGEKRGTKRPRQEEDSKEVGAAGASEAAVATKPAAGGVC